MSQSFHAPRWLWVAGIGLGLVSVAVVCVLLNTNSRTLSEPPSEVARDQPMRDTSVAVSSSTPTTAPAGIVAEELPMLPRLNFPSGSIEEACGLNEYVPYHFDDPDNEFHWPNSPYNANGELVALESKECRTALENHINTINPLLWGSTYKNLDYIGQPFDFFMLENPLTFERIFSDPAGDLARVQDALSRSECLLTGDETNWELKETCHAESFLNYALINQFCFDDGIYDRKRTHYFENDDLNPEQDRFLWKQDLEDAWVGKKCEELDQMLELTEHTTFYEVMISLLDREELPAWFKKEGEELSIPRGWSQKILIELAARLGDDAAGLTMSYKVKGAGESYHEAGYSYGRFNQFLVSAEWTGFALKKRPEANRFFKTFTMLAIASARRPDPRDEIDFDWEWVARHLCEPPYYPWNSESEESAKPKSCQEIVHELRQRDITIAPVLRALDKFEQVALELGVYE